MRTALRLVRIKSTCLVSRAGNVAHSTYLVGYPVKQELSFSDDEFRISIGTCTPFRVEGHSPEIKNEFRETARRLSIRLRRLLSHR